MELEYSGGRMQGTTITIPEPDAGLQYTIAVQDGPPVDVVFLEINEYRNLSNGQPFRYFAEASMLNTERGGVNETLPAGEYAILVDNSEILGGPEWIQLRRESVWVRLEVQIQVPEEIATPDGSSIQPDASASMPFDIEIR